MYGKQIGLMIYGGGTNARTVADTFRRDGYVVVWRDGYLTAHESGKPEPKGKPRK